MKPWLRMMLLIVSLPMMCWLGMMLMHERGHMVAAWVTGGRIAHLSFSPLAFSRTDISPNPHPLPVAWGGPLLGALIPYGLALFLRGMRVSCYVADVFAAFCLLANGSYIGLGSVERIGDAADLLKYGSSVWTLWGFGLAGVSLGMWEFHRLGPFFGITTRAKTRDALIALGCAGILLIVGMVVGP